MFGGTFFLLWVGANSSKYIDTSFHGDKYKLRYNKLIQTVFWNGCQLVTYPSHGKSTFLVITEGWLPQEPRHCNHCLKRFICYQLKN